MGVEAVADTLGSLGDLIPDLIFGTDDQYEEEGQQGGRDRDQVVVGGSRGSLVKKRGGNDKAVEVPHEEAEYATDEETDDWTKED